MTDRRTRWGIVLPILLLVALTVVLTNVFPFRQILAQRQQVEIASEQLAVLQEENARLDAEAAALRTPTEIERMARNDFGLVREGDTSFVIVEPTVGAAPEAVTQEPLPQSSSFLDSVWNFLTGRDLIQDG
ncbi:MAG: septum formation initiator family protein [Acidimicrobiia bacterium]|nr:septum formation initiator family protein [Acidimicrobiia bacterium]